MIVYHFKMQAATAAGAGTGAVKDLETDYPGLKYMKCEGLEEVGKPKNIYTEDYAEQNGPRVYHPTDSSGTVTHEETKIKLSLLFTSRSAYHDFRAFLETGRLFYWDTARHLKVFLVLLDEVKVQDDSVKDGGYVQVDFTFTNLWGIGRPCNDNGVLV